MDDFFRYAQKTAQRLIESINDSIQPPTFHQVGIESQYAYQADEYFRGGLYESAVLAYTAALILDPKNPKLLKWRGLANYWCGKYDAAIADLNQVIYRNHADDDVYKFRAYSFFQIDYYQAAIGDFNIILRFLPDNIDALRLRAYSYLALEDYPSAIADYLALLEMTVEDDIRVKSLANLGHCLYKTEQLEKSFDTYAKIEDINPSSEYSYIGRAAILLKQKKYASALDYYDQLIAIQPDKAKSHIWRGICLWRLQKQDEAFEEFKLAISSEPEDSDSYNNIAWYHANAGQLDVALPHAHKAIYLDGAKSHNYDTRAIIYWLQADYAHALADFSTAYTLSSKSALSLLGKAVCLDAMDDEKSAIVYWNRALELDEKLVDLSILEDEYHYPEKYVSAVKAIAEKAEKAKPKD